MDLTSKILLMLAAFGTVLTMLPAASALPDVCVSGDASPCNSAATCTAGSGGCTGSRLVGACTHTLGFYGPCFFACADGTLYVRTVNSELIRGC